MISTSDTAPKVARSVGFTPKRKLGLSRMGQAGRLTTGADDQRHAGEGARTLRCRKVQLGKRLAVESSLMNTACHSNDGPPTVPLDFLTHWILTPEILTRQRVVDHRHGQRICRVLG